jgi:hypothetical protein
MNRRDGSRPCQSSVLLSMPYPDATARMAAIATTTTAMLQRLAADRVRKGWGGGAEATAGTLPAPHMAAREWPTCRGDNYYTPAKTLGFPPPHSPRMTCDEEGGQCPMMKLRNVLLGLSTAATLLGLWALNLPRAALVGALAAGPMPPEGLVAGVSLLIEDGGAQLFGLAGLLCATAAGAKNAKSTAPQPVLWALLSALALLVVELTRTAGQPLDVSRGVLAVAPDQWARACGTPITHDTLQRALWLWDKLHLHATRRRSCIGCARGDDVLSTVRAHPVTGACVCT